jgi:hypothetical protein
MSKESKNLWGIVAALAAVVVSFISGAFFFGKDFGQSKFDKEKIELSDRNNALIHENDSLKLTLAECTRGFNTAVAIASPVDKSTIDNPGNFSVTGTISGLPAEKHLWLVIHPETAKGWWPQISEIIPDNDGSWHRPGLRLGGDNNVGERFELHMVIADDHANELFNSSNYLVSSEGNPLPAGARSIEHVTVIKGGR